VSRIPEAEPASGSRRLPAPTRRQVLEGLATEFEAGGIPGGRQEAERLLSHVLGLSRTELLLHPYDAITPEDAGLVAAASRRRLSGVPLQHLEGTVAFRDLVLVCDGRALVPRPETEELVQRVVDWASARRSKGGVRPVRRPGEPTPLLATALDIGTGGGCIALSLLHEGVVGRVVAVDISEDALELAAQNAERVGVGDRIELRATTGSPWSAVQPGETFDVIVSNPPYVPDAEIENLAREVRDHDPFEALAGGVDGLVVVREIVAGAPSRLSRGGALFLEVGVGQGREVSRLLSESGSWADIQVTRDLAGRERVVIARA